MYVKNNICYIFEILYLFILVKFLGFSLLVVVEVEVVLVCDFDEVIIILDVDLGDV